jgi:hypothetical protein
MQPWFIPMFYISGAVVARREASPFDLEDRRMALQEDRQGIGLSRTSIDFA